MSRAKKYPTPPTSEVHPASRSKILAQVINDAFDRFSGQADDFEKAAGMLMIGDYFGWKALAIIHNKRTIKKYEAILGIEVREFFPEEGPIAMRLRGYEYSVKRGNFWKMDSGDETTENRREI